MSQAIQSPGKQIDITYTANHLLRLNTTQDRLRASHPTV